MNEQLLKGAVFALLLIFDEFKKCVIREEVISKCQMSEYALLVGKESFSQSRESFLSESVVANIQDLKGCVDG